ncbi:MAG: IclR family transcriptional regulator [Lentilitoribacter sp.]
MTKKENEDRYRAPALDKGLDILELLAEQPQGMTRSEIVKTMGRSPSEIYRMIERLVVRGYVTRSSGGDRYALSMKLFLLGSAHPPIRRLITYAQPFMDRFANETFQSIHLAVPEGGYAIVIAQASGPANWEFRLRVGAELDLINTGSGRTLLAFQDERGLERLFPLAKGSEKRAKFKPTAELRKELDDIKKQGYRLLESGQLVGITDVSVPVNGSDGNAFGVLTCPYIERVNPRSELKTRKSIDEIKSQLLELATAISIE